MKNKAEIIKFYQDIDWVDLLDKSDELNKAFQWIDKIIVKQNNNVIVINKRK